MANSKLFCFPFKHAGGKSTIFQGNNKELNSPVAEPSSSTEPQVDLAGMQIVRQSLIECQISPDISDIIMSSWRDSTRKQYKVFIDKWLKFCLPRQCNPVSPTIPIVLEFLHELFKGGYSYSSLNSARSAISNICVNYNDCAGTQAIGKHPLVCRYLKGIFNSVPPTPKFTEIWSVESVLEHLEHFGPVETLKLKELSLKLAMLVALVSGQRCQTLSCLDVSGEHMKKLDSYYSFALSAHLKQDRPGKVFGNLRLFRCTRKQLCVYTTLERYLLVTESLRKSSKLFVSYIKPHDKVSSSTIGRWIKTVLSQAGIDVRLYQAHSTRAASASKAAGVIPIDMLMKLAGWSQESTFRKFYDKSVAVTDQMSNAILNSVNNTSN